MQFAAAGTNSKLVCDARLLSMREKKEKEEIEIRSVSVYHYGNQSVYQSTLQIKNVGHVSTETDKEVEIFAQRWKMTSF